ncbi:HlyD family efflux transporter periplasmic adaptor subunit [Fulvivirga sp. M361]|uniref:efflux RND transporter periplasmic adaptor subunit n=1 Tax=Fulvivirga sp. M361 TaxID=2594266 RepID=UPI00117B8533|nr:HlyD family efflux transporter periplasmic adaptor subunit [Fulvivirga sp. M361]TRX56067.1 HlyD family efflux transporter periplasmic adaptor subunit [Fulvivirga sp. M361]
MKNKLIIGLGALAVILVAWLFMGDSNAENGDIFVEAKRGTFTVEVTTTGELEAQNSVKVMGPTGLRAAQMWQVKIEHLVEEGTVVQKGDYIGRLDQSELSDKVQNRETELQQSLSKYTQTRLDTALELRAARDELVNLKYAVEEKEIILSQSQYEPPATIKQAEIDLAKAKRALDQAVENYKLKTQKAIAEMQEAAARLAEDQGKFDFLDRLKQQFTILAPESGMVVYHREWDGSKIGIGGTIRAWEPVVATLPDLTSMISRTYINEVDIRSIKKGQQVNIGLDAFPDKSLSGKVVNVANIGEQKPNSDSKVFEVKILINESDTTLRPAMTTSNGIIAEMIPDVVYVPLECIHSQGDSLSYVIKRDGLSYAKQEVILGQINTNEVVIEAGIEEGELLYLSVPDGIEDQPVSQLKNKPQSIATNN